MKETPILFSTPMVQAILNGTKTQTRRVVKRQPINDNILKCYIPEAAVMEDAQGRPLSSNPNLDVIKNPYGKPGDIIFVKETYYALGQWKKNGLSKTGKQKWKFIDSGKLWFYEDHKPTTIRKNSYRKLGWYKRPSLFMPKAAARLWLQITGIRVERLQTITEADAKAEGVQIGYCQQQHTRTELITYKDYQTNQHALITAGASFKSLWFSINGTESWAANPYVWVIEFKVISKTGKP